jgi:hypothetical protein
MRRNRGTLLLLSIACLICMATFARSQSDDVRIIEDVAKWKHPVKGVFQKYGVVVEKVELRNKGTYPLFYVRLQYDPHLAHNDGYFRRLYAAVLKANGYWDYELVSQLDDVRIRITYDRKTKTLREEVIGLDDERQLLDCL